MQIRANEPRWPALVAACVAALERACRTIYPRVALLSVFLAGSTALVLWGLGATLIEDGTVVWLFTIAMLAIAASLCRDIYGALVAVRIPLRRK